METINKDTGEIVIYKNDWHVKGVGLNGNAIAENVKSQTLIVGSESDCRMISKLMVSSGKWEYAGVYSPGSNSEHPHNTPTPYEVYTVPNLGGTRGTESDSIDWIGWEHHKFDE